MEPSVTSSRRSRSPLGASGLLGLLLCAPLAAQDWPRFLGPNLDGTTRADSLITGWTDHGLEECWRRPIGEGYSGLAVVGESLYSLDADGRSEFVFALSSDSGEELWRVRLGPEPRDWYGGLGPRVTPTVDGDRLILMSAGGDLLALARDDGRVLWRRPVREDLDGRFPVEGYSAAALVEGDRIFLPIGGTRGRALAAFDRDDGSVLWTSQSDRAAYASPVSAKLAGREQVLFLTASRLFAVAPGDGALLWSHPWETYDGVNAATPLVLPDDRVFLSSEYDQGAVMLQVSREGERFEVEELWRTREMQNHFNNSVFHDGVLYGFDQSFLTALDAQTGERLWRERGLGKGSLIVVSDHLVVLGEDGELFLARPDRERFVVLDRREVLSGRSWTPPSVAGNRLYLRDRTEIVCLLPHPR